MGNTSITCEMLDVAGVSVRVTHPEYLAEQESVNWVDRSVDGGTDGSQEHVRPLGTIILQDPSDSRRCDVGFTLLRRRECVKNVERWKGLLC